MSGFPGLFKTSYSTRRITPPVEGLALNVLLAYSPDGRYMARQDEQRFIYVYEIDPIRLKSRLVQKMDGHKNPSAAAFSPDNSLLALCYLDDCHIHLWSVPTGRLLKQQHGHKLLVTDMVFSPDGKLLASGSKDSTIRLRSIETGETVELNGHTDRIECVTFSPDGKLVASSDDETIRLWTVTGQLLKTLKGYHARWTRKIAFMDEELLVSVSSNGMAQFWSVSSGRQLRLYRSDLLPYDITFAANEILLHSLYEIEILSLNKDRIRKISAPDCSRRLCSVRSQTKTAIYTDDAVLIDHVGNFQLVLGLRWPCSHLYDPRVWRDVARFL